MYIIPKSASKKIIAPQPFPGATNNIPSKNTKTISEYSKFFLKIAFVFFLFFISISIILKMVFRHIYNMRQNVIAFIIKVLIDYIKKSIIYQA